MCLSALCRTLDTGCNRTRQDSMHTRGTPCTGYIGPYAITKTTLLGLTNILAQSLRPMNIRVNGLALGLINTRFSDVIRKTKELESKIIPIGVQRFGQPEECAGVASFLCSKDASYINGENIAVTGGILGRL
uniref:SDR family oxidoreductase n=1 Tax=Leptobrachium leishanense TaxID=445787 RepID=A0A8C5QM00_9ANUR